MIDQVVLLETTLVQVALLASVKYAFEHAPTGLALVDLQMLLQIASTRKRLGAVAALEWLFTCVNAGVPDQVRHLTEGLVAARYQARVRPLFVVHSRMLLQRRVLRKYLMAVAANEPFSVVVSPLVLFQRFLAIKELRAFSYRTFEKHLYWGRIIFLINSFLIKTVLN